MKPPIPLPYGAPKAPSAIDSERANTGPSATLCVCAIGCSLILILAALGDVGTTFGRSCLKGPSGLIFTMPLLVPFIHLLWAKELSLLGLVARAAFTGALAAWVLGMGLCLCWPFGF